MVQYMHKNRKISISRQSVVKLLSFFVVGIVAFTAGVFTNYSKAVKYQNEINISYLRGFTDLNSYIFDINSTLEKAQYASTPAQIVIVSGEISRASYGAKAALEQLPLADTNLDKTSRFLSQVGDFSLTLARKAVINGNLSDEDRNILYQMREYASVLSGELYFIWEEINKGKISFEKVNNLLSNISEDNPQNKPILGEGIKGIEEQFAEYPTLIYDGPYSSHIENMSAKFISDKSEVSKEEMKNLASSYLDIPANALQEKDSFAGSIPGTTFGKDDISIDISKKGGYLLQYLNPKEVKESKIDVNAANAAAIAFLGKTKFENMKQNYYMIESNVCTFNFAFQDGDVLYYPDLIKIGVSMETGEIISFDARGYLINHYNREQPIGLMLEKDASAKIDKGLTVESARLAVIPTPGLNEVLCYEFKCSSQVGDQILVYINAKTGVEEQLLILIETENGTLTK